METTQKITLKGLRKEAKAKFRAKRTTILMYSGGLILMLGAFLYWVLSREINNIIFSLPMAVGLVIMVYGLTLQENYVDRQIELWASNGQQLPEGLKK
jgi:hypothetical protein